MTMTEQAMEGAVHTNAVVNFMGESTVNVSHDLIPEIGWPAMTMDMPVREDAQVMDDIVPGVPVVLMLIRGENGMYEIAVIMPQ